jgi:signal transduction histidine kinase
MKKHQSAQYISIFILAQVAWLTLLGLWIYRYVTSSMILTGVGGKVPHVLAFERTNVLALVGGLILLIAVSLGMSLIFARLSIQLRIAQLYDNFIANVTHELKSPLASIQLMLETLITRKISERKRKEFIDLMIQDAGRLNSLINTILEISSLERKSVAHHFEVYSADSMVQSIVREAMEQFKLPQESVRVSGSADCQCVADRRALQIVFNNLFDNAIKYSKGKPEIFVRSKSLFKNLVVTIRDRGIGISIQDQKKIFDKFQRIYGPDIPSVKGTGLGLYWVKEIVNYHGGRVSVFSAGKGRGSTFRIELPIYKAAKKRRVNHLLKISQRKRIQQDA